MHSFYDMQMFSKQNGVPDKLELKGARKWLAYRLLTGNRRMSMQPGLVFRLRQLAVQFFLSGNVRGWLRYYFYFTEAKFRDLLGGAARRFPDH
jgi:hypothetical protein